MVRGNVHMAMSAIVAASLGLASPEPSLSQDTSLRIEQMPKARQDEEAALDAGLLEEGVKTARIPERSEDLDVASTDPACVPGRRKSVSESYGIPVIEDSTERASKLLPGVTINQSRKLTR